MPLRTLPYMPATVGLPFNPETGSTGMEDR
jgi:hypothetical protein